MCSRQVYGSEDLAKVCLGKRWKSSGRKTLVHPRVKQQCKCPLMGYKHISRYLRNEVYYFIMYNVVCRKCKKVYIKNIKNCPNGLLFFSLWDDYSRVYDQYHEDILLLLYFCDDEKAMWALHDRIEHPKINQFL